VKSTTRAARRVVTADGAGIVSHAGAALLRELADESGLTQGWTAALLGTYKGVPVHLPGRVLTDLAVTLADGGDCLADLAAFRDQAARFGPVASHPTAYRVLDRVGAVELWALRAARADARARVWAAGGGPDLTDVSGLILDVDASLLAAHSEKEGAAPSYKHGFGFHPLLVFPGRPDVFGGEALAAILRPGNAGSNTAADHLTVLDLALAQLPEHARRTAGVPGGGPQVLIRADSAGATHAFMAGCRERGVRYSVGLSVDQKIQDAIAGVPAGAWIPAISADGEPRGNGEIVELTALLDLSAWPPGSRVICRRERPTPGQQLRAAMGHCASERTPSTCPSRSAPSYRRSRPILGGTPASKPMLRRASRSSASDVLTLSATAGPASTRSHTCSTCVRATAARTPVPN